MASPIVRFYNSVLVQDAFYWGDPVNDGYGGRSYNVGKKIKVRWDEVQEIFRSFGGEERVSRAKVMVKDKLSFNGYLKLLDPNISYNTPDDWTDLTDPNRIIWAKPNGNNMTSPAYTIVGLDNVPLFKSKDEFIRTVHVI